MSISTLQIAAFETSPGFVAQVNMIVRREAEYKASLLDPMDPATDGKRAVYRQVITDPSRYGFVAGVVASVTWAISYDVWASDTAAADDEIMGEVQILWSTLVGV